MIKAVYTGTFDPVTNGHLDIIERASKMYDVLYVTIFINPHKTCLFTVEERMEMLREATKQFPNVVIDESSSLAVEYARDVGAQVLVRGLRATEDYNYESLMCFTNQYLDDGIETVFLMTRSSLAVEYARDVGAQVLVRGLRATEDYNYESLMCFTNQYLDDGIETVFLMTRLAYTFVSSSFVKEIVSHKHSVEGLVPACVEKKLIEKYRG